MTDEEKEIISKAIKKVLTDAIILAIRELLEDESKRKEISKLIMGDNTHDVIKVWTRKNGTE